MTPLTPKTHAKIFARGTIDIEVIGGGSGGLAATKAASDLGAKVAVADFVKPSPAGTTWGIGGTCVNVGCIPTLGLETHVADQVQLFDICLEIDFTLERLAVQHWGWKKLMHISSLYRETQTDAHGMGWETKSSHSWSGMVNQVNDYIKSLNWGTKTDLRSKNIKYYNSFATFKDAHTISLDNGKRKKDEVSAKYILIACGGRPAYGDALQAKLPVIKIRALGSIQECCISSDDIFWQKKAPGKTLVIGASYIALETKAIHRMREHDGQLWAMCCASQPSGFESLAGARPAHDAGSILNRIRRPKGRSRLHGLLR
eukprot:s2610_g4.t1